MTHRPSSVAMGRTSRWRYDTTLERTGTKVAFRVADRLGGLAFGQLSAVLGELWSRRRRLLRFLLRGASELDGSDRHRRAAGRGRAVPGVEPRAQHPGARGHRRHLGAGP